MDESTHIPQSFPPEMSRSVGLVVLLVVTCLLWTANAIAQDLAPRTYWPAPKGTKVAVFGYQYSSGNVLMDPSIPLYGVNSRINTAFVAYLQTFDFLGRTTNVVVELPYSWGTTEGFFLAIPARSDISGFNDFAVTLGINLVGAPSMGPAEYQQLRARPPQLLGMSVKVQAPTGKYDTSRLINSGANRWAVGTELGYLVPITPEWLLELEAGAWFFGDDEKFLQGRRQQKPVYSVEAHLVRRFKPGFWASLQVNYFMGGRQTIGGNSLIDLQSNSRVGGTLAMPIRGRHSIKVGYSTGIFTEFGEDLDQFLVTYLLLLN